MEYISDFDDLMRIKKNGEYELKNDIDCENKKISSILTYFTGYLNGCSFKIKNLIISDEIWGDEQTLALFSSMNHAEIKDITFENITMEYSRGCYKPRIGVLAGTCTDCTISEVLMLVSNSSNNETPMIYEASNCEMKNNKIICNGKEVPVVKYG